MVGGARDRVVVMIEGEWIACRIEGMGLDGGERGGRRGALRGWGVCIILTRGKRTRRRIDQKQTRSKLQSPKQPPINNINNHPGRRRQAPLPQGRGPLVALRRHPRRARAARRLVRVRGVCADRRHRRQGIASGSVCGESVQGCVLPFRCVVLCVANHPHNKHTPLLACNK